MPNALQPIHPVSFTAVHLTPGFWATRIETNRTRTIPAALRKCEESGRLRNFERAASVLRGDDSIDTAAPGYPFDDTDVYKVVEGACYVLSTQPDPALDARIDRIIATISGAQEPDGYLYTTRTICPDAPHPWSGRQRWELETNLSHELYNLGHLYEAAVAHHEATQKSSLLEIALRSVDLLLRTFGPGLQSIWPGHQITELALARLYRITFDPRHLALARFLLDERAPDGKPRSGELSNQSHARVLEQTEAVGHAVRATYMYAGMADIASLAGAADYVAPLDRIWNDVVAHKLYVTGGIGARLVNEAFGAAYELPNLTAYSETCAAIGLVYWSHRMFLLHGHGSAIDVLERVLYNGLLAGVSLDGEAFFYPNPLESFGEYERSPWFGCACCPGNIARFMASVPGYVYAHRGEDVYVNLFAAGRAHVTLDTGTRLTLEQETEYPWQGAVRLTLRSLVGPRALALKVRIPGWARGEPVPSDLYRFVDRDGPEPTLSLNGAHVPMHVESGYLTIRREWQEGDQLELSLPMPARRVAAHPRVDANDGRMALQRGPVVYALEGHDHQGGEVLDAVIEDDVPLQATFRPDLLGGLVTISGRGRRLQRDAHGQMLRRTVSFTAIPYFAWANRGPSEMLVWIPRDEKNAWVRPTPTLASRSAVTASSGECRRAANDQAEPASSRDDSHKRVRLQPGSDGALWIQYAFPEPARVERSAVYWFDSPDYRRETAPASWKLLYWNGERWQPVETRDLCGVELDTYNEVRFAPVVTSALRLEASARPGSAVGLLEWQVG